MTGSGRPNMRMCALFCTNLWNMRMHECTIKQPWKSAPLPSVVGIESVQLVLRSDIFSHSGTGQTPENLSCSHAGQKINI